MQYYSSMKATTIKVEGDLLQELERTKPARQSLSGYVRALLEQALRRQTLVEAAERYTEFVRETPDEAEWLGEWESADLARPPPAAKATKRGQK
jgi:predicted CopG family antitoxin